ncbi:MAG: zf-HC2 domain-containing protein [Kiritimatiellae bacterium]|nr:zf-HC2 domain-containing protein [Kiritimatiellia bacterium]
MLSCKDVTRLVSEALDRDLPLHQRLGVRLHFLFCRVCALYKRQLLILRDLIRRAVARFESSAPVSLPPDARERIRQSIRESQLKELDDQ